MTVAVTWLSSSQSDSGKSHDFIEVHLTSWQEFYGHIESDPTNFSPFIWRGQRQSSWSLTTGLDRIFEDSERDDIAIAAMRHLERFKLAARGRRGLNPNLPQDDDEWWALAQHNAMLTPLLDWSESPFVALYFAFEKEETTPSSSRAVWALSTLLERDGDVVPTEASRLGKSRGLGSGRRSSAGLDFIRPMLDDNSRLVSQSGLFTRAPFGQTVEQWVSSEDAPDSQNPKLIKFIISDTGRTQCLRLLNRMNINHRNLFPDLYGAAKNCNYALTIENY